MRIRHIRIIAVGIFLLLEIFLGACHRATTPLTPAQSLTPSSTPSPMRATEIIVSPTGVAYPQPSSQVIATPTVIAYPQPSSQVIASPTVIAYPQPPGPVSSPTAKFTSTLPPPQATATELLVSPSPVTPVSSPYPGPGGQPNNTQPYPGPQFTETTGPYVPPVTPTRRPIRTPSSTGTPARTLPATAFPTSPGGTVFPSPTPRTGTPVSTPTELPPRPPLSPPPPGSAVTIWHSWGPLETQALQSIIQSFQRIYPDVTFTLQYVPLDDLFDTYQEASYLGQGPSLMLGPARWGPTLFDQELIADLNPYVPPKFLADINPAALSSGKYHNALISLPLSQYGMVLFRNNKIIESAPATFEELIDLSRQVTRKGVVGAYLERGSYFSAADIVGLGGNLMDEDGYPAFDDSVGQEWFNLLTDFRKAGAVTFNTNRDLDMFKRGRVGIIIDGTWNLSLLASVIGMDNLAIDPWPTYGTGNMSGWVECDSVFLNANTTGGDRFASLAFMGYLLDPEVQMLLAEVGHIPSVSAAQPRDPLLKQAMEAFSHGSPYPIFVSDTILSQYWDELDKAIRNVFSNGANPSDALKTASDNLTIYLKSLPASP